MFGDPSPGTRAGPERATGLPLPRGVVFGRRHRPPALPALAPARGLLSGLPLGLPPGRVLRGRGECHGWWVRGGVVQMRRTGVRKCERPGPWGSRTGGSPLTAPGGGRAVAAALMAGRPWEGQGGCGRQWGCESCLGCRVSQAAGGVQGQQDGGLLAFRTEARVSWGRGLPFAALKRSLLAGIGASSFWASSLLPGAWLLAGGRLRLRCPAWGSPRAFWSCVGPVAMAPSCSGWAGRRRRRVPACQGPGPSEAWGSFFPPWGVSWPVLGRPDRSRSHWRAQKALAMGRGLLGPEPGHLPEGGHPASARSRPSTGQPLPAGSLPSGAGILFLRLSQNQLPCPPAS